MRAFACVLLIVSLFTREAALPHTHADAGIAEPAGHHLRPHIHVADPQRIAADAGRDEQDGFERDVLDSLYDWRSEPIAHWHRTASSDHDETAVYLEVGGTMGFAGPNTKAFANAAPCVGLAAAACPTSAERLFAGPPSNNLEGVPIFLASTRLLV